MEYNESGPEAVFSHRPGLTTTLVLISQEASWL
jgi:hypothetical protein